ncbi:cytochrome P450 [Haladaptatus sp. R4]|uniref:cytochrome P450 n=1 Tax=Haladaptatus sp. R4 TaxID=1679489 RepID=UPI0007B4B4A6|nr:cytochrome P450 [Haladaptatus sp. R4]KZN25512.1 cytochrome P450 [Haladaptatus sp. R4]
MANRVPSGPEGVPFLGSSLQYADDPLGFMERVAREYGDVARIDVYGTEVYQVADPEAIRRVLVTNAENYRKPTLGGDEGLGGLLGDGLLTSDGEHWRRQRTVMQPSFYGEKLNEYGDIIVRDTTELADSFTDGEHTNIHAEMSQLTLRIVVESLLGSRIDGMERAIREALIEVGERFQPGPAGFVPEEAPTPRNVRYRRAVDRLDRILREIRRQHDYSGDEDDLLGTLLGEREAGNLTDESVRNEMMTLLLAGHDTTALTLTYAWYLLAKHPDVRRKFHDELDAVVDGTPTVADLTDLDYLDEIVTETMRLYPPAYVVYRQANEADDLAGFHVPADTVVSTPQWVVHHDERFFDDPWEFRPERWTDEFRRELPQFAYFPFGGGPRKCIGDGFAMREAKLVLATLGKRFEFDLVSDTPLTLVPLVTLHPENPVEVTVKDR